MCWNIDWIGNRSPKSRAIYIGSGCIADTLLGLAIDGKRDPVSPKEPPGLPKGESQINAEIEPH